MARSSGGLRAAVVAGAYIALTSFAAAAATAGDDDASVEAIWKAQHMSFEYRGYSTRYSCRGLQQKLTKVLLHLGARGHIMLRNYGCDDQAGYARFQISLESPVEATPENIRDVTTYEPAQVLLAHTRGEQLATPEDVQRFPAVWKTVSFARDHAMQLDAGDCDLVRELRRQILNKMSVRIERDNLRCSPGFGNLGPPRLTISALVPAPVGVK
jgi:hypothetical protein